MSARFLLLLSSFFVIASCAHQMDMRAGSSTAAEDAPLKLLKTLVEIESDTSNITGVNRVQSLIQDELKRMGFKTVLKPHPQGRDKSGYLLLGTYAGKDPRYITFLSHADTVFTPSQTFRKFTFNPDGKTATGPGIIDNKGGIVVALQGIEQFLRNNDARFSLRFVVTPSEETGSPGFKEELQEISRDSIMVLGFEPSHDDGSVIMARRGARQYFVKVVGKEAHAARSHKEGINACRELSTKVAQLEMLTDYDQDTIVNVGHMEGGADKYNIVCGFAQAKIDSRFPNVSLGKDLHRAIDTVLKTQFIKSFSSHEPAQTSYTIAIDIPPMDASKESMPFIDKYRKILQSAEKKEIGAVRIGGTADANQMARKELIIFDGLGPTGGKLHTTDEFLNIRTIHTRISALVEFLKQLPEDF